MQSALHEVQGFIAMFVMGIESQNKMTADSKKNSTCDTG